jgi:hypothetical protein
LRIGVQATVRHDGAKRRLGCKEANSQRLCCTRDEGRPLGLGCRTPAQALALLRDGKADVMASARPDLLLLSTNLAGARILADRYGAMLNRIVVAKGKTVKSLQATSPIMPCPQIVGRSQRSGITWPTSGAARFGDAARRTALRGTG